MLTSRAPTRFFARSIFPVAVLALLVTAAWMMGTAQADDDDPKGPVPSSYDQIAPVLLGKGSFKAVMTKDKADKAAVMARQKKLLEERYDLTPRPDKTVKMTRGKPIPVGPTARLRGHDLGDVGRDSHRRDPRTGLVPQGISAAAASQASVGGMVFPQQEIKLLPALERFDVDFDLPEHFCPSSRRRCS